MKVEDLTPLQVWSLIKKYLNAYNHRSVEANIDIETVEGYPISIIEDSLKALQIIKSKEINIHALLLHLKRFNSPEGYNTVVGDKYRLTQEDYNLLKKILE